MNVKKILLMTLIGAPVVNVGMVDQAVGMITLKIDDVVSLEKNVNSIFFGKKNLTNFFKKCCFFINNVRSKNVFDDNVRSVFDEAWQKKGRMYERKIGKELYEKIVAAMDDTVKNLINTVGTGKKFLKNEVDTEECQNTWDSVSKIFELIKSIDSNKINEDEFNVICYLFEPNKDWSGAFRKYIAEGGMTKNWIVDKGGSTIYQEYLSICKDYFAPKHKLADAVANAVNNGKEFLLVENDEVLDNEQILKQIKFLCEKNGETLNKNTHVLNFEEALRLPVGDCKSPLLDRLSALFEKTKELRINDADFGVNNEGVFEPHTDSDKQKRLWQIIASKLLSEIDNVITAYGEESLFDKEKKIKVNEFVNEFNYDKYENITKVFAAYCKVYNDKRRTNLKVRHFVHKFKYLSREKQENILNCDIAFNTADKRNKSFEKLYESISSLKLFDNVNEMIRFEISAIDWVTSFVEGTEDENIKINTIDDLFKYLPNSEDTKKMITDYNEASKKFKLSSEYELHKILLNIPVVVSNDDSFLDDKNWKTSQFKTLKVEYLKNLVSSWSTFIAGYPKQKIGAGVSLGDVLNDLMEYKGIEDLLELSPGDKIFPEEVYSNILSQKINKNGITRDNVVAEFNQIYNNTISTEYNLKQNGNYSLEYLSRVLKPESAKKYLVAIGQKISEKRGNKDSKLNEGISNFLSGEEFASFFSTLSFENLPKNCCSGVSAESNANDIANNGGAALIDALANSFNTRNPTLKTLDIQSKKIKGEEFVKQILEVKDEYSADEMFKQCIAFAEKENREQISKKYEVASKMPQKKEGEFFDLVNETSGRISYATLSKYHLNKNNLDALRKEFSGSYIEEVAARLDTYGEDVGVFTENSKIQTILSNKTAFPENIYGKDGVTLGKLFDDASDEHKNIFSPKIWETALEKTVADCNQWKRKNISADLLMDTVSQAVENEVDGNIYSISELLENIPGLWEFCVKSMVKKNAEMNVDPKNVASNHGLRCKIKNQYVKMSNKDNGWTQLCSQILDKVDLSDLNVRVVQLSEIEQNVKKKDYASIENKDEFISGVNENVWHRIEKASKLPGSSESGSLKDRVYNCFTDSQEIYLTGDEFDENSVDRGVVKAIDYVVDDWENEIPAELSKEEDQTEKVVLSLTVGEKGINEFGVPLDKGKFAAALNSTTPVSKEKLTRGKLWNTSKEILLKSESAKGQRKLTDFYMSGSDVDEDAFEKWVSQSKTKENTFDGLAVVLSKKIAEDALKKDAALTHDKAQPVAPENIIDWLKDPASKEIVDQIQITTNMDTTADQAVEALADAFMNNENFKKMNLGDMVGVQVPLVDVLKVMLNDEDKKMLFGEESGQNFDTLFDENQPGFQDNCLKFIKFASHKLANGGNKDFVDNELHLNTEMYKPFTEALWLPLGHEFFNRVFAGENAVKGLFQKKDTNDKNVDFKKPDTLASVKPENKGELLKKYLERFLQRVNNSLETFKNEQIFTGKNVRGIDVVNQLDLDLNEFDQVDPDALPLNKQGLKRVLDKEIPCEISRSKFLPSFMSKCVEEYTKTKWVNENRCSLLDIMKCKNSVFYKIISKLHSKYLEIHKTDSEGNVSLECFISWLFGTDYGLGVLNEKICFCATDDISNLSDKVFNVCCLNNDFSMGRFISVSKNDENFERIFEKYKEKCAEFMTSYGITFNENDEDVVKVLNDVFIQREYDDADNELSLNLENCVDNVLYERFLRFKENMKSKTISKYQEGESCCIRDLMLTSNDNVFKMFVLDNKIKERVQNNPALFCISNNSKIGDIVSLLKCMNRGIVVDEIDEHNSSIQPEEMSYLSKDNKERFKIVCDDIDNIHTKLIESFEEKGYENVKVNSSLYKFLHDSCSTVVPNLRQSNEEKLEFKLVMSELFKKNGLMNKFFGSNDIKSVVNGTFTYEKIVKDIKNIESVKENAYKKGEMSLSFNDKSRETNKEMRDKSNMTIIRKKMDDEKNEKMSTVINNEIRKNSENEKEIMINDKKIINQVKNEGGIINNESNTNSNRDDKEKADEDEEKLIYDKNEEELIYDEKEKSCDDKDEIIINNENMDKCGKDENKMVTLIKKTNDNKNEEMKSDKNVITANDKKIDFTSKLSGKKNEMASEKIEKEKVNDAAPRYNIDEETSNDIVIKDKNNTEISRNNDESNANEENKNAKVSVFNVKEKTDVDRDKNKKVIERVNNSEEIKSVDFIKEVLKRYPYARFTNVNNPSDCPSLKEVLDEFDPNKTSKSRVLKEFYYYRADGNIKDGIDILYRD